MNLEDVNLPDHIVDSRSLNENQMMVFKQVESHYTFLLTNPECVNPLRHRFRNCWYWKILFNKDDSGSAL